jgi:hypothetical protein
LNPAIKRTMRKLIGYISFFCISCFFSSTSGAAPASPDTDQNTLLDSINNILRNTAEVKTVMSFRGGDTVVITMTDDHDAYFIFRIADIYTVWDSSGEHIDGIEAVPCDGRHEGAQAYINFNTDGITVAFLRLSCIDNVTLFHLQNLVVQLLNMNRSVIAKH